MSEATTALGGGFHHLALRVEDFEKTVKFYTEGLGLKPVLSWGEGAGRAVMLDTGNSNYLEIFAGGTRATTAQGAMLHFALRATDVDAALQRALDHGAQLQMAPTAMTIPSSPAPANVYIAFCVGPDGEIIEFFQSEDV